MSYVLAVPSYQVQVGPGATLLRTDSTLETATKVKEIVCTHAGAYQLRVSAMNSSSTAGSWVAFYRNGAVVGNQNPVGGSGAGASTWRTFVESIGNWKAGELMQVYTSTAAGTTSVQNFQIWAQLQQFTLPLIPPGSVNLD